MIFYKASGPPKTNPASGNNEIQACLYKRHKVLRSVYLNLSVYLDLVGFVRLVAMVNVGQTLCVA